MLSPRGTHRLQCRPSGRQWKAASPASWRSMLALIIRMPSPGAAGGGGGRRAGPAVLGPAQEKAARLQFPIYFHAPRHHRQRTIFGGIGGELVQRERERLGGARLERHVGAGGRDPFGGVRAIGS